MPTNPVAHDPNGEPIRTNGRTFVKVKQPNSLVPSGKSVKFAGVVEGAERDSKGQYLRIRVWVERNANQFGRAPKSRIKRVGRFDKVRLARVEHCRVAEPSIALRREWRERSHLASVIKERDEALAKGKADKRKKAIKRRRSKK